MPFYIGFTKVKHYFDIRKKSEEYFEYWTLDL